MFDIKENLKKLPDTPGVYLHKDSLGQVIYVGKAISLRNRVRQYFQSKKNMDAKVRAMVGHIAEFEYITCGSEMEAFILECNLIKKYRPKYNILLRDDKTYPYIKVTVASEEFPRLVKTRRIDRSGDKYFGPYSDVRAVNQMIDFLNGIYRLKKCQTQNFPPNHRACLNSHIGQCDAMCVKQVDKEAYMQRVGLAMDYLNGKNREVVAYLERQMQLASETLDYERAAFYRDRLFSAKSLSEQQRVVIKSDKAMDVLVPVAGKFIALFTVRDGKLVGRESFAMQKADEDSQRDMLAAFIKLHYASMAGGPSEIVTPFDLEEANIVAEYLSSLWGKKILISKPERGERKALLALAMKDANELAKTIEEREKNRNEREEKLYEEMSALFERSGQPCDDEVYRMEAYDISNTNGVDTVGAMVVFEGSKPNKKAYRKFKVRTIEGPNDYGSMQEVLYRRFKHMQNGEDDWKCPSALLIDGGKGHVAAANQILSAMGAKVPVFGLAKDDSHRTRAVVWQNGDDFIEESLKGNHTLFKYFGTIQEEVHRFAIEYHRSLRDKGKLHSVLDEIAGIGPAKRNALLEHFGSVENIKSATDAELLKVKGMTPKLVEALRSYLG